jgi:hypothetical protein
MTTGQILLLALPLIVIQLGLMLFALRDLTAPGRTVRGGSKALWAVVIVLGELFGPLFYLFAGRIED